MAKTNDCTANRVQELQRTIVNFFWSGQHWALHLLLHKCGQGLVDISSRIMAFRLQAAQRLLYSDGSSWVDTAYTLMRRAGRLGLDKHIFLLKREGCDLSGLTPFYESVMQAWRVLDKSRKASMLPGMWLFEEPPFLQHCHPVLCSGFSQPTFMPVRCGVYQAGSFDAVQEQIVGGAGRKSRDPVISLTE